MKRIIVLMAAIALLSCIVLGQPTEDRTSTKAALSAESERILKTEGEIAFKAGQEAYAAMKAAKNDEERATATLLHQGKLLVYLAQFSDADLREALHARYLAGALTSVATENLMSIFMTRMRSKKPSPPNATSPTYNCPTGGSGNGFVRNPCGNYPMPVKVPSGRYNMPGSGPVRMTENGTVSDQHSNSTRTN